jgi:hypothetical protein
LAVPYHHAKKGMPKALLACASRAARPTQRLYSLVGKAHMPEYLCCAVHIVQRHLELSPLGFHLEFQDKSSPLRGAPDAKALQMLATERSAQVALVTLTLWNKRSLNSVSATGKSPESSEESPYPLRRHPAPDWSYMASRGRRGTITLPKRAQVPQNLRRSSFALAEVRWVMDGAHVRPRSE